MSIPKLRFRNIYLIGFSVITLALLFLTSPDVHILDGLEYGGGFVATLVLLMRAVVYVAILHFSRKALFDYIDLEYIYDRCKENPIALGLFAVMIGLAMISIAALIVAAAHY